MAKYRKYVRCGYCYHPFTGWGSEQKWYRIDECVNCGRIGLAVEVRTYNVYPEPRWHWFSLRNPITVHYGSYYGFVNKSVFTPTNITALLTPSRLNIGRENRVDHILPEFLSLDVIPGFTLRGFEITDHGHFTVDFFLDQDLYKPFKKLLLTIAKKDLLRREKLRQFLSVRWDNSCRHYENHIIDSPVPLWSWEGKVMGRSRVTLEAVASEVRTFVDKIMNVR